MVVRPNSVLVVFSLMSKRKKSMTNVFLITQPLHNSSSGYVKRGGDHRFLEGKRGKGFMFDWSWRINTKMEQGKIKFRLRVKTRTFRRQTARLHQRDPIVHATSVWWVAFSCFKEKGNRLRTGFLSFDSSTLTITKSGWPVVRDSWRTGEVWDSCPIGAGESTLRG